MTVKLRLWLISNDINLEVLKHFLFKTIQMLHENSALFSISIPKTFAVAVKTHCALWNKTLANLENNFKITNKFFITI